MNAFAPWTDAEREFVKLRHAAGASASETAAELKGRSRNGVIGLWSRLGLSKVAVVHVAKPASISKQPGRLQNPTRILAKANGHDPGLAEEYELPSPFNAGITLDELTNTTCRWPSGTPGEDNFRYCGQPGADMTAKYPLPYCGTHSRMACEPTQSRKVRA